MEIKQIKEIQAAVAVAKNSSFSLAAVELNFSQSAISKQISALEKELGIRLFERKASSAVTLTPQGEALLPQFETILKDFENLDALARSLKTPDRQVLNFSSPPALGNWGEDRLILNFYKKYPDTPICYHSETGVNLIRKIALGEIDVCTFFDINHNFEILLRSCGQNPDHYGHLFIEPCRLLLAFSDRFPQAGCEHVAISDFKDRIFLMKNFNALSGQDLGTEQFIRFCRSAGFTPRIEFTNEQKRSIIFARIASGEAVAPLLSAPEASYPGVSVLPVEHADSYAEKRLYYLKSNRSQALKAFLRASRELMRL